MDEIEIKGSYFETGYTLGKLHRDILKKFEGKIVKGSKFGFEEIKEYEKAFHSFPSLWEEMEGYCKGANLTVETLLSLRNSDIVLPEGSCTSLYINSDFTEEAVPVAMKIRDEKPLPQYIAKKENINKTPYFFSGSISSIGIAFFAKENGFIGINNTGSPLKQEFVNSHGFLDDCDITRIIAEVCEEPYEAVEVIRKLQKDRIIGYTGKKRGMIFLFAKEDNAILVEINSFMLNLKRIEGKIGVTNDFLIDNSKEWIRDIKSQGAESSKMRKKRVDEIIKGKLNKTDLFDITRDKKNYPYSICRDTSLMPIRTISSFIVYFYPSPLVWVCCGHPYVSPYFPFEIKGKKILDVFINGNVSLRLNVLFCEKGMNDTDYLETIKSVENSFEEKLKDEKIEFKNIEIQKLVYQFIVS